MTTQSRQLAFDAFSERLKPLGLHPDKARQLFSGSTLFLRFQPRRFPIGERAFAGGDDLQATYSEESFSTICAYYRMAITERPTVERLFKEAQKELATAQKGMALLSS
jgi:hypothetical protein